MQVALTRSETGCLESALSTLLSTPAKHEADAWRLEVLRVIRALVGADRGVFVLESDGALRLNADGLAREVTRVYQRHFAALDLGIQCLRASGLEVWSRAMLWRHARLTRSEYFNDFVVPYRLHSAVGLAATLRWPSAHVRISLVHDRPVPRGVTERQVALLALLRPAFRAAMRVHVCDAATAPSPSGEEVASLLDAVEEPAALYSGSGRLLHRNATMALVLEEDASARRHPPDRGLDEVVRDVVRDVVRVASSPSSAGAARHTVALRVRTATAMYRVCGIVVPRRTGAVSMPTTVLVTLRRAAADLEGGAPELRRRFGLTARESDVARLLLQRRSNAEIAAMLTLSPHTTRHHTERVLQKLGVHSRTALAERLHQA